MLEELIKALSATLNIVFKVKFSIITGLFVVGTLNKLYANPLVVY